MRPLFHFLRKPNGASFLVRQTRYFYIVDLVISMRNDHKRCSEVGRRSGSKPELVGILFRNRSVCILYPYEGSAWNDNFGGMCGARAVEVGGSRRRGIEVGSEACVPFAKPQGAGVRQQSARARLCEKKWRGTRSGCGRADRNEVAGFYSRALLRPETNDRKKGIRKEGKFIPAVATRVKQRLYYWTQRCSTIAAIAAADAMRGMRLPVDKNLPRNQSSIGVNASVLGYRRVIIHTVFAGGRALSVYISLIF